MSSAKEPSSAEPWGRPNNRLKLTSGARQDWSAARSLSGCWADLNLSNEDTDSVTPARATAFLVIVCALYFVLCFLAWGRSVMESERAIADVILVTRAETTYATLNGGFSEGDLSCLERPGTCVPSAPAQWAGRTVAPTPL